MHAKINKPSLQSNEKLGENILTDKRQIKEASANQLDNTQEYLQF